MASPHKSQALLHACEEAQVCNDSRTSLGALCEFRNQVRPLYQGRASDLGFNISQTCPESPIVKALKLQECTSTGAVHPSIE